MPDWQKEVVFIDQSRVVLVTYQKELVFDWVQEVWSFVDVIQILSGRVNCHIHRDVDTVSHVQLMDVHNTGEPSAGAHVNVICLIVSNSNISVHVGIEAVAVWWNPQNLPLLTQWAHSTVGCRVPTQILGVDPLY